SRRIVGVETEVVEVQPLREIQRGPRTLGGMPSRSTRWTTRPSMIRVRMWRLRDICSYSILLLRRIPCNELDGWIWRQNSLNSLMDLRFSGLIERRMDGLLHYKIYVFPVDPS